MKYYKRCYYILIIRGCDINFQKNKFPHVIVQRLRTSLLDLLISITEPRKIKNKKYQRKWEAGAEGRCYANPPRSPF